jgi:hypothetical protein
VSALVVVADDSVAFPLFPWFGHVALLVSFALIDAVHQRSMSSLMFEAQRS